MADLEFSVSAFETYGHEGRSNKLDTECHDQTLKDKLALYSALIFSTPKFNHLPLHYALRTFPPSIKSARFASSLIKSSSFRKIMSLMQAIRQSASVELRCVALQLYTS